MTLQRVLTRLRDEGGETELKASWADKQAAGMDLSAGRTKELIESAVIWVRPKPRQIAVLCPTFRDLNTSHADARNCPVSTSQMDFMSVPQSAAAKANGTLHKAITSIPAYVASASLFLCICPRIKHREFAEECDLASWSMRAWVSC
jgi:hypothetical protein